MSDEFEFKPLTEGLGFHKKLIDISEDGDSESIRVVEPPPRRTPSEMPSPRYTDKILPQAVPTTARPTQPFIHPSGPNPKVTAAAARAASFSDAVTEEKLWKAAAPPTIGFLELPQEAMPGFADDSETYYSWGAAGFDALIVIGLTFIFGAFVFAVTHVSYFSFMEMLQSELISQVALATLLFVVYELYSVIARAFFGRTLGEWAFGIRLGPRDAQQRWWYPLAVAWRSLVIVVTGVLVIPLISTATGVDVAGKLSGISLRRDNR